MCRLDGLLPLRDNDGRIVSKLAFSVAGTDLTASAAPVLMRDPSEVAEVLLLAEENEFDEMLDIGVVGGVEKASLSSSSSSSL